MIGTKKILTLDSKHYRVNYEIYSSCSEMLSDLNRRQITDLRFKNVQEEKLNARWCGVRTYDKALSLLEKGYSPAVKKLYEEIRIKNGRKINGMNRNKMLTTSVVGYQPIVPLALKGVPNNMLVRKNERNEARVINLIVDITCLCDIEIQHLIRCGIRLMKIIYNLEMCGHRINLFISVGFAGESSADILLIKTKSSDGLLNLRRISFPLCHTAFLRVIAFDWYSKFPRGIYRDRYGITLNTELGREGAADLIRKVFGSTFVYITYDDIESGGESYIKKILGIEKLA